MSKTSFNSIQRAAIWNAHNCMCFYCMQPLTWGELHIDHIIPEKYLVDLAGLEAIKKEFGLSCDFDINSFRNLVPVHSKCNQRKSATNFDKPAALFFLAEAAKKVGAVEVEYEKLRSDRTFGRIVSKIAPGIVTNRISIDEVKEAIYTAAEAKWQEVPFVLPEGVRLIDEMIKTFKKGESLNHLYDSPFKLWGEHEPSGLELTLDDGTKTEVRTLNEFKKAKEEGYYGLTTPDIKAETMLSYIDELFQNLTNAKPPQISFLNNPFVDLTMLDQLSPLILWHPNDEHDAYLLFSARDGKSVSDLLSEGRVKVLKNDKVQGLELKFGGFIYSYVEQFRADLNDDGIEDIFVEGWTRASGGTFGAGTSYKFTKYSSKHLIEPSK